MSKKRSLRYSASKVCSKAVVQSAKVVKESSIEAIDSFFKVDRCEDEFGSVLIDDDEEERGSNVPSAFHSHKYGLYSYKSSGLKSSYSSDDVTELGVGQNEWEFDSCSGSDGHELASQDARADVVSFRSPVFERCLPRIPTAAVVDCEALQKHALHCTTETPMPPAHDSGCVIDDVMSQEEQCPQQLTPITVELTQDSTASSKSGSCCGGAEGGRLSPVLAPAPSSQLIVDIGSPTAVTHVATYSHHTGRIQHTVPAAVTDRSPDMFTHSGRLSVKPPATGDMVKVRLREPHCASIITRRRNSNLKRGGLSGLASRLFHRIRSDNAMWQHVIASDPRCCERHIRVLVEWCVNVSTAAARGRFRVYGSYLGTYTSESTVSAPHYLHAPHHHQQQPATQHILHLEQQLKSPRHSNKSDGLGGGADLCILLDHRHLAALNGLRHDTCCSCAHPLHSPARCSQPLQSPDTTAVTSGRRVLAVYPPWNQFVCRDLTYLTNCYKAVPSAQAHDSKTSRCSRDQIYR